MDTGERREPPLDTSRPRRGPSPVRRPRSTNALRSLARGALLVAWLCGCGTNDADDPAGTGKADAGRDGDGRADAAASVDAALPARPSEPIMITGHVNGGLFAMERPPVTVCVLDEPDFDCVETDDIGLYAIAAPGNARVALHFEGEDLTPTLRAFVTGDEDLELGNTRVPYEGSMQPVASALGVEIDPDKGVVLFAGIETVSADLEPASGQRFFINMAGQLLEDAVWIETRGSGGFLNVDPGEVALRFSRPHASCAFNSSNTMSGWPDPGDHTRAIVPVLPGHHVSAISMDCGVTLSP